MKPYSTYKTTGLDWLPQIPAHWEVKRLKFSVSEVVEQTNVKDKDEIYVALEHVESWSGRLIPPKQEAIFESNVKKFKTGDILFGRLRPYLAKALLAPQNGVCVGEFLVLRIKFNTEVDEKFLHLRLLAKDSIELINSSTFGAKMPRASWEFIGNTKFPLPPISEQRAIVSYLDAKGREIAVYIAAKRALVSKLQELKVALIARAVTRGLDTNAKTQASGVEWMGEVPAHWEIKRLRRVIRTCANGVWGEDPKPDDENNLVCVRVADFDMKNLCVGKEKLTIRNVEPNVQASRLLKRGDLLIEKSGGGENQPVGRVVLFDLDEKAVCSNFVARVVPEPAVDSRFLLYVFHVFDRSKMLGRHIKQTTGIQNLDADSFFQELIPLPPLSEQAAIVSYIEAQSFHIDAARLAAEREIELALELSTTLVAEVVCGARDVRGQGLELSPDAQQLLAEIDIVSQPSGSGKAEEMESGREEESESGGDEEE